MNIIDRFVVQQHTHNSRRPYRHRFFLPNPRPSYQALRVKRADQMRHFVMRKLLRALEAARINNWVSKASYTSNAGRPWGPNMQFVRCFAITAGTARPEVAQHQTTLYSPVLRVTPDALFGKNAGRLSVLKRALKRKEVYFRGIEGGPDPTIMNTLDALRNFRGPFGLMSTPLDTLDFADEALNSPVVQPKGIPTSTKMERGFLGTAPSSKTKGVKATGGARVP